MSLWNTRREGSVVISSYENPPLNYFCAEAVAEFTALIEAWQDPAIRVVVLTGVDGQFITHYSVEELCALAEDAEAMRSSGPRIVESYHAMLLSLRALPKPVIAALSGDTMGGGFELAMSCDIRIAADGDYRIGLPEIRLGITPGGTGTQALPRLIGVARAMEFILRGRVVTPVVARDLGLVHEVAGDALGRAMEMARDLATQPPTALAAVKACIYNGSDLELSQGLAIERDMFQKTMLSADASKFMRKYLAVSLDRRRGWLDSSA